MAITPIELLEEVDRELERAKGRVMTAMAHVKIERRSRLAEAMKEQLPKEETPTVVIPTEAVKQFLTGTIVTLVTGGLVTWLSGAQVLNFLHISSSTAASDITGAVTFLGVSGITWLTQHHILLGTYSKAGK